MTGNTKASCNWCNNNKNIVTWVEATGTTACSDTAITLDGVTCSVPDNCAMGGCYDNSGTDYAGCLWCNSYYYPSPPNADGISSSCTFANFTNSAISECVTYGHNGSMITCEQCHFGNVVAYDRVSC